MALYLQAKPKRHIRRHLKQYSAESLSLAYKAVKEKAMSVKKAARTYGVPTQTLRDRVLKKVHIDAVMGNETLFTRDEEEVLVQHCEKLSKLGYGINRAQLSLLAKDLAVKLGGRNKSEKLSNNWHYGFMNRWKDRLSIMKPRSLTSLRAQNLTQETVNKYYDDLESILNKYQLKEKPHLIYYLDETGLQPEHRPPQLLPASQVNLRL